ncbi:protein-export chaperone SecB [Cohaesibacter gelatinilyticus]|jgi:preprotein translocase subunit SecB|uniref:Protein-export protein SecB n=1 Tax=Cohaesibacter gelatinilyticus TaxID=372072 RepID=A0A285PF90_9HYPH|nr:protein-export chaperone SecB [Cohaesibacter gelatinilyticus]SNZ19897.1 protein translocase subunit secB [Cohaesibacter gelatinilyticus]
MSDAQDNGASQGQEIQMPNLRILAQYIKDLSFENPNAPDSLRPRENAPEINIQINVNAAPLSESEFEAELTLNATAQDGETTLFNVELLFAGVFAIENVPQDQLHPFVMIECPRMLFPFARQVISDATMRGGFPPLNVDPIDFAALYRQRMMELAAQEQENQTQQ